MLATERVHTLDALADRAQALLPPEAVPAPLYRRVAAQLHVWNVPAPLVVCGLLLRHIERQVVCAGQLAAAFGGAAAEIAQALLAVSSVPRPSLQNVAATWRLFTLAALHPDAALLKVTESYCQANSPQGLSPALDADQLAAAAHVAGRLGMWDVRTELHNAQLQLADLALFRRTNNLVQHADAMFHEFFQSLSSSLARRLAEQGIHARIERRPRTLRTLVDAGLEQSHSSFPWSDMVVVIVPEVLACYQALGLVNSAFDTTSASVRDYIGTPKHSGYRALHTTIEYTNPEEPGQTAKVAMRFVTPEMDRFNREGYLAYLARHTAQLSPPAWWDDRQRWQRAHTGESQEIFIFTPIGETIFLPSTATVLDFAVRVHSELGIYCRGAQLNGQYVLPGERLACGDICEVLIDQRNQTASPHLLGQAKTATARARIRRALQADQTAAQRGRALVRTVLAERLKEQEASASEDFIEQQLAVLCQRWGYPSAEALYLAVARNDVAPDKIVRWIVDLLLVPRLDVSHVPHNDERPVRRVHLAYCCKPRPSLPAVATLIQGGRQIQVHTATCSRAVQPSYPVVWKAAEPPAYVADVLYESWDRPGLIHTVTHAIHGIGSINIRKFEADVPEPQLARIRFSFETRDETDIAAVRQTLEALPERRHVEMRVVSLLDEGFRITTPLSNPYSPQPVGRWPLFVGRTAEVRHISALLAVQAGARHILIRGPKRIGKSSLLEHLAHYHLAGFKTPRPLNFQALPTEELAFPRLVSRFSRLVAECAGPRADLVPLDTQQIAADPISAFGDFLAQARSKHEAERFVVLIDEFGAVMGRLPPYTYNEFFDQWRTLLNTASVYEHVSFIVALPDLALWRLHGDHSFEAPESNVSRVGELGESVRLSVLDETDARDLITAPTKAHLEYHPSDVSLLLRETGGHPYYLHLVCGQIVSAIQVRQRSMGFDSYERHRVTSRTVRAALDRVQQHEDAFFHVLKDSSPETGAVLRSISQLAEACANVPRAKLVAWLKSQKAGTDHRAIDRALRERPDLLVEEGNAVGLRVALVARWLRRHA